MNGKMISYFTAGLVLAITIATTCASAQDAGLEQIRRMPDVRAAVSACSADRSRLCSDVTPGGGRVLRCLTARPELLSAGCVSAIKKAGIAMTAAGYNPGTGGLSR